jgi:hypothetical protein
VGAEYVGRARASRERIVKARIGDDGPAGSLACPGNHDWLNSHALSYEALALPTRLAIVGDVSSRLRLAEIRVRPSRMTFADWGGGNEPSIAVVLRMVTTAPFADEITTIGDLGLHSLARRIERGRPNDDGAVLADLRALADGYRAAVAKGEDFAIATKTGGKWLGAVTTVRGAPVLAVRTFVD